MSKSLTTVLDGLKKPRSVEQALANTTKVVRECDKALIIAVDTSGSMGSEFANGKSRIDVLWDIVKNELPQRMQGYTFGVIAFGLDTMNSVNFVIYPTNDARTLASATRIEALGSTPMLGGLNMAWDWISNHAKQARIILISDGQPTDANESTILSNCMRMCNIPIDTIALSTEGEDILRKISNATNGIFSRPGNINVLTDTIIKLSPEKRLLLGTI